MREGKADYLALRVVNNFTGAEICGDLPHLHQTLWQVRAIPQGLSGGATLGTFRIRLFPPGSDEFKKNFDLYQSLDLTAGKLRIEGFLGGKITGTPQFSGVVTGGKRPLDQPWEITGVDSLWMLQQSQVLPGELVGSGALTANVAKRFWGTMESVWDDDFSGWNGAVSPKSSDYNVGANWAFTSADPYRGEPALVGTGGVSIDSSVTTVTTWTTTGLGGGNHEFDECVVRITGTLDGGAGAGVEAEASVLLMCSSSSNPLEGHMVSLYLTPTGAAGWYLARVFTWHRIAGTYNATSGPTTYFPAVVSPFPFQLEAIMCIIPNTTTSSPGTGQFIIKVLVNGQDVGQTGSIVAPGAPAAIGVRIGSTTGSKTYVNRIQFQSRANGGWSAARFTQEANLGPDVALPMSMPVNGQTYLDMQSLLATFRGKDLRKTAGFGHKSDKIGGFLGFTGNIALGKDWSSTITLEEGVNILAEGTEIGTVPELLGTDVRLNTVPGGSTGGSVTWGRIAKLNEPVLTDTVNDVGIPGFDLMVNYARSIQALKVNPLVATKVRVVRDAEWLSVNNGAGPRELEYVSVYMPNLGVQRKTAKIMGYDFEEGSPFQNVYLNALPQSASPVQTLQRIVRPLDYLATTYKQR